MRWIPRALILLSLAGAGVSAYLLSFRLLERPVVCLTGSGCAEVNASEYSALFGIPVSAYGLLLYIVLIGLAFIWLRRGEDLPEWLTLSVFGLSLAGFLFSAYLTYVEAFIIRAYCTWCLVSFGIITVTLAVATLGAVRRSP